MNGDVEERRLRAVLAEHQLTRQEITATNGRKSSLIQFYLLYLAAAYGYILGGNKPGLIPIVAIGAAAFFAAWIFEHELVILLSAYLRDEIERKRFPQLLADSQSGHGWVDWQHYYGQRLTRAAGWLYRLFAIILFGFFGVGPSILFSVGVLAQAVPDEHLYMGTHPWPYVMAAALASAAALYCSCVLFARRTRDIESGAWLTR